MHHFYPTTITLATLSLLCFGPVPATTASTAATFDCPLSCVADGNAVVVDSQWTVWFDAVANGTGQEETCTTCTTCKGIVNWVYVGVKHWTISFEGGEANGNGSCSGFKSMSSGCDDADPEVLSGDTGMAHNIAFLATLYCRCAPH